MGFLTCLFACGPTSDEPLESNAEESISSSTQPGPGGQAGSKRLGEVPPSKAPDLDVSTEDPLALASEQAVARDPRERSKEVPSNTQTRSHPTTRQRNEAAHRSSFGVRHGGGDSGRLMLLQPARKFPDKKRGIHSLCKARY